MHGHGPDVRRDDRAALPSIIGRAASRPRSGACACACASRGVRGAKRIDRVCPVIFCDGTGAGRGARRGECRVHDPFGEVVIVGWNESAVGEPGLDLVRQGDSFVSQPGVHGDAQIQALSFALSTRL
jgi:hypothetical protein